MANEQWMTLEELAEEQMFDPFEESLVMLQNLLKNHLTSGNKKDTIKTEKQLCTDADKNGKCRAKDPSKCRVHGTGSGGNKLSATGANPSIPKMTEACQKRHRKHLGKGKSYEGMTMDEYVKKSLELAQSPVGNNILGYRGEDGFIVRYDKENNDWVKAYQTGIATMYKPKRGIDYYNEQMKADMKRR